MFLNTFLFCRFLRQLRKNRDEENELMKNVPGWEAGKIDGEPVYWNQAKRFHVVSPEEYYMHNKWSDMYTRLVEKSYHWRGPFRELWGMYVCLKLTPAKSAPWL